MDLEGLVGAESLEELVAQIRKAAEKAAETMVSKRLARYQDDAEKIMTYMDRIPPLPGSMTQEELIHELTRALLARVRYALPDAQSVLSGAEG